MSLKTAELEAAEGLELPAELPITSPDLERLRAFFGEQYARILAHDPGVRLGEDPEDVHQLRVAVRRLRSVLRTARPVLDRTWVDGLRSELAWLAGELGPARDLDVLIPALWADAGTLERADRQALTPLFAKFEKARAAAGTQALEALRSDRYYALLASIEAAAANPPPGGKGSLEKVVRKEYKRLRRAMRKVDDDPTDDAIHRARIKGKRARYATELLEDDLGKPGQKLIAAAKEFQDVAGEHHDSVVAEQQIRVQLRGLRSQATALAAGLLIGLQRERRRAAFDKLPQVWKRFDRAAKKVSA
jgi:CHAD domain-containing protein